MNSNIWEITVNQQTIKLPVTYFQNELNPNEYNEALNELNKLIELLPNHDTYALRGRIHFLAHQYDQAIADYEESDDRCSSEGVGTKPIDWYAWYYQLVPDRDRLFFDYAEACLKIGKRREAAVKYIFYIGEHYDDLDRRDRIIQTCIFAGQIATELKDVDLTESFYGTLLDIAAKLIKPQTDDYMFEPFFELIRQNHDDLVEAKQNLEASNKKLKQQEKELEDMMSMFAHKFRSPLDTIIYNTDHERQPQLYKQAAQTMRGLLDIFSTISTDADTLKEKLKQDCQGEGNLTRLFTHILDMTLLHLLSVSAIEKIQQHYFQYAKKNGLCSANLNFMEWNDEHFELERRLQLEWEQSYARLVNDSTSLEERLCWLEQHFFKLNVIGFDRIDVQFKEYGITASFLTILIQEVLINVFKYYSSAENQSVVLEWQDRDGYQVLCCRNPSERSERSKLKGSGKGHVFLSALAHKIDSQFNKPRLQDDFVLEFVMANDLLISS